MGSEVSAVLRVLVVDDDSSIGQAISRILGSTYDVEVETEGKVALARIEQGARFDAVVCDVEMPQPDGGRFFDAVKAIAPELAARFVFVSGGVSAPPRPGVPFVGKPFTRAQLVEAIHRVVAQ